MDENPYKSPEAAGMEAKSGKTWIAAAKTPSILLPVDGGIFGIWLTRHEQPSGPGAIEYPACLAVAGFMIGILVELYRGPRP
jgi:hypothetical protein